MTSHRSHVTNGFAGLHPSRSRRREDGILSGRVRSCWRENAGPAVGPVALTAETGRLTRSVGCFFQNGFEQRLVIHRHTGQ